MDHVDRLFVNLKIVASVQPYQKINTKGGDHILIEAGYWVSPCFTRWLRDDNRLNTVKRVNEVLEEAERLLLTEGSDQEQSLRVKRQLVQTRSGLVNLRQTYEADPTILAHFDVMLDKLDALTETSGTME